MSISNDPKNPSIALFFGPDNFFIHFDDYGVGDVFTGKNGTKVRVLEKNDNTKSMKLRYENTQFRLNRSEDVSPPPTIPNPNYLAGGRHYKVSINSSESMLVGFPRLAVASEVETEAVTLLLSYAPEEDLHLIKKITFSNELLIHDVFGRKEAGGTAGYNGDLSLALAFVHKMGAAVKVEDLVNTNVIDLFLHELGHLFGHAHSTAEHPHRPAGWEGVVSADGNRVSDYSGLGGRDNDPIAEDFAEFYADYMKSRRENQLDAFRKKFPNRTKLFEQMVAKGAKQ